MLLLLNFRKSAQSLMYILPTYMGQVGSQPYTYVDPIPYTILAMIQNISKIYSYVLAVRNANTFSTQTNRICLVYSITQIDIHNILSLLEIKFLRLQSISNLCQIIILISFLLHTRVYASHVSFPYSVLLIALYSSNGCRLLLFLGVAYLGAVTTIGRFGILRKLVYALN